MAKKNSDLTKQVWKFQEGAVVLVLRQILSKSQMVHWNHKRDLTPEGMSIDPDIILGLENNKPDAIIFVTHAAAETASNFKFWRTVAEVIEIKRIHKKSKTFSILYSSRIKENIRKAYSLLFDEVFHLDNLTQGAKISDHLFSLTKQYGKKSPEKCLQILDKEVNNGTFVHWKVFKKKIKDLVNYKHRAKHQIIADFDFSDNSRIPSARKTSLRKSIGKLLTLPLPCRNSLLEDQELVDVPVHAEIMNWIKEDIAGYVLDDHELQAFVKKETREFIDYIIHYAEQHLSIFSEYTKNLQRIQTQEVYQQWIIDHFDYLCRKNNMKKTMQQIFKNPAKLLENQLPDDLSPNTHWLFSSLIILLRTETGRKDGYGYSVLGKETGISRIHLLGGLYLQLKREIDDRKLEKICAVFANHLVRIQKTKCKQLYEKSIKVNCDSIFKYKLMNYMHYNPINWLVCRKLSQAGYSYVDKDRHPSCFSNDTSGRTASTANIISVNAKKCWIKCQSAYNGRIDKRKELCGRIGAMKLCYTPAELKEKTFFLVLDGYFNNEDLRLLDQAGWDGIFYYDELDELLKAIEAANS